MDINFPCKNKNVQIKKKLSSGGYFGNGVWITDRNFQTKNKVQKNTVVLVVINPPKANLCVLKATGKK